MFQNWKRRTTGYTVRYGTVWPLKVNRWYRSAAQARHVSRQYDWIGWYTTIICHRCGCAVSNDCPHYYEELLGEE
jgi:hypothetical protein